MKKLKFKRNSWHHEIAILGGIDRYEEADDFCSYVRKFAAGSAIGLFFLVMSLSTICAVGDFLSWLAAMVAVHGYIEPTVFAFAVTFLIILCAVIGMMAGLHILGQKIRRKNLAMRQSGVYIEPAPIFISKAYRSVKDKICFRIELD